MLFHTTVYYIYLQLRQHSNCVKMTVLFLQCGYAVAVLENSKMLWVTFKAGRQEHGTNVGWK